MLIQGTATDYIDLAAVIRDTAQERGLSAVAVNAGGTGYTVGDLLTVAGGTTTGAGAATIEVTSVSSGVIDGVKVKMSGAYSSDPTTTANAVTGGTGSSATIDLTMADYGWTEERDTAYSGSDREIILNGEGAGSDEIFVGIRTYNDGAVFNWELAGMTGYSSGDIWDDQPGISPGRYDMADPDDGGAFVALATTAAQNLEYWIQIDSYAIVGVARNSTSYQSFYLGWLNPFGTSSEFTYPLCVAGNTPDPETAFNSSDIWNSGITDPIHHDANDADGPCLYRNAAGTWQSFINGFAANGSGRTIATDRLVFPAGGPPTTTAGDIPEEDLVFEDQFRFASTSGQNNIIPQSATPGTVDYTLAQTPDTGGDITFLWPATLIEWNGVNALQGEMRHVYWIHNDGGIVAEDDFRIGGVDFRVFQAGTRTNNWAFWALREN